MGNNPSQLEKEIGSVQLPANEHYFGLVNFGNTCYCNSVLQALYFCRPFREKVLQYKQQQKNQKKETLLTCLADLFYSIATQKKKVGTLAPKRFVTRLRKEYELFDNYMQQDAHEFLNYLLNRVAELLQAEKQGNKGKNGENHSKPEPTWVEELFQGTFTNETRCLNCETVSSKDEDFLDLSVDVEQNTSITHCLRGFSCTETLCAEHKYYCEVCCSKQEAQKRMRVKKLPQILALHLKRFKYTEQLKRFTKLSYRVVFPLELRLFNTHKQKLDFITANRYHFMISDTFRHHERVDIDHKMNCADWSRFDIETMLAHLVPMMEPILGLNSDDAFNPDRMYDLVAVVIHIGSSINRGHYISIVKSEDIWILFDDDIVDKIEASAIEDFYGLTSDLQKNSETGYILFYQSRE